MPAMRQVLQSTENVVRKVRSSHDTSKQKVKSNSRTLSHQFAVNQSQNHRHHHHTHPHVHPHHYQYYHHGSHQYYSRPQPYPLTNARLHNIPRIKEEEQSSPSLTSSSKASEPMQKPPGKVRSPFMCYSESKKKEMKEKGITLDDEHLLDDVAAFEALSEKEKAFWDEEARQYSVELARKQRAYTGPSYEKKKRKKKDPDAPKRPMSAFLEYSQKNRKKMKEAHPSVQNTDISRLLGQKWRTMSEDEKRPYEDREKNERAAYKERMRIWKEKKDREDAAAKTCHEAASPIFRPNQHRHQDCVPTIATRLDRIHIDPLVEEEASSKRPHYYTIRTQYPGHDYFTWDSHNQHPWPDLSIQHSMDPDAEPLPTETPGMPNSLQVVKNEDGTGDQQTNRGFYFPESCYQFPQYL